MSTKKITMENHLKVKAGHGGINGIAIQEAEAWNKPGLHCKLHFWMDAQNYHASQQNYHDVKNVLKFV